MTRAEIEAERDRLGMQYAEGLPPGYDATIYKLSAICDFNKGFNAAIELMLKREAILREVLQSYANLPKGHYYGPDDVYYDLGMAAYEALAEVPEWEAGEEE